MSIVQSVKKETQKQLRMNKQPPFEKILHLASIIIEIEDLERREELIKAYRELSDLALMNYIKRAKIQDKVICKTYLEQGV